MSNVALRCRQDDIVATFSSRVVTDTGIKLSMYRKICTLYRVVLPVFGLRLGHTWCRPMYRKTWVLTIFRIGFVSLDRYTAAILSGAS